MSTLCATVKPKQCGTPLECCSDFAFTHHVEREPRGNYQSLHAGQSWPRFCSFGESSIESTPAGDRPFYVPWICAGADESAGRWGDKGRPAAALLLFCLLGQPAW